MAAWAGFSEDELRKVKQMANPRSIQRPRKSPGRKVTGHGNNVREEEEPKQATSSNLDHSMMLNKKQNQQSTHQPASCDDHTEPTPTHDESSPKPVDTPTTIQDQESHIKIEDLDDEQALNRDMKSLEKFREQQKAIEEANKQKKAMLAKTLSERKKKAEAEAYKLAHVQKELSKLDCLLTADVQVIRDKIEGASRDFMDAQRRFERAEKEYVAAKMDLHQKSELKEQLTEHLYTIIHQNEVRKAKKLADIMKELDMESGGEDVLLPELPPLSSFHPPTNPVSLTGPLSPTKSSSNTESTHVCSTQVDKSGDSAGITVENTTGTNTNASTNEQSESASSGGSSNELPECDKANKSVNSSERTDVTNIVLKEEARTESTGSNDLEHKPSDNTQNKENIKVGQTSKLLSDMKAHVDKELETVNVLMANADTMDNTAIKEEAPKIPSKWDFDGSIR